MFLKKLIRFLFILVIALSLSLLLNKVIVNKLFEDEAKLPPETKWLALGDSHITNSINPRDYPWLVNRAHSGERLLYNFEKVKYYVDNNPQLEVVIVSYWYNTMFYDLDWVLYGKDAQYRYESYLPLQILNNTDIGYLNVSENKRLFWENYWGFKIGYPSPAVKLAVKNFCIGNRRLEMRGGFRIANGLYSEKSTAKKDTTKLIVDSLAQKHLREMVLFLENRNVKLVFLNTPVTEEFLKPMNMVNINLSDSIVRSYVDNKNVWYLDYTNHKIGDEFFNDLHHLNIDGANYFTPLVVDTILRLIK